MLQREVMPKTLLYIDDMLLSSKSWYVDLASLTNN
jgi:hypothetical protein